MSDEMTIEEALSEMDGSLEKAVCLLAGLTREQIEEVGGLPE